MYFRIAHSGHLGKWQQYWNFTWLAYFPWKVTPTEYLCQIGACIIFWTIFTLICSTIWAEQLYRSQWPWVTRKCLGQQDFQHQFAWGATWIWVNQILWYFWWFKFCLHNFYLREGKNEDTVVRLSHRWQHYNDVVQSFLESDLKMGWWVDKKMIWTNQGLTLLKLKAFSRKLGCDWLIFYQCGRALTLRSSPTNGHQGKLFCWWHWLSVPRCLVSCDVKPCWFVCSWLSYGYFSLFQQ